MYVSVAGIVCIIVVSTLTDDWKLFSVVDNSFTVHSSPFTRTTVVTACRNGIKIASASLQFRDLGDKSSGSECAILVFVLV